jgi:hypothetical protein
MVKILHHDVEILGKGAVFKDNQQGLLEAGLN